MGAGLVAVGASLGGLDALTLLLRELPAELPAAVVIVQHRRPHADSRLVELLARRSALPITEPTNGEPIRAGHAYLAPADYHLLVEPGRFALSTEAAVAYARPSIDVLFESVAEAYAALAVGVALTGASADGAAGAAALAASGATIIVQDPAEAESPVSPRAVLACVAHASVLPLSRIAPRLRALCGLVP